MAFGSPSPRPAVRRDLHAVGAGEREAGLLHRPMFPDPAAPWDHARGEPGPGRVGTGRSRRRVGSGRHTRRRMDHLLILCTGNATRSVIAGAVLRHHLPDVEVATAGTLSIDGLAMSWRTRAGFESVGLPVPQHRSRQARAEDIERATLVIGLAPEHVAWVRREHPAAASRTATLKRLHRELAGDDRPLAGGSPSSTSLTSRSSRGRRSSTRAAARSRRSRPAPGRSSTSSTSWSTASAPASRGDRPADSGVWPQRSPTTSSRSVDRHPNGEAGMGGAGRSSAGHTDLVHRRAR